MLEEQVMDKVNDAYSLNPPLQRDDMDVDRYTDAESDADVHSVKDEDGLVVLIKPKKPAAQRIRRRFHTLKENRRKTSQLMGFIRDSDEEDADTVEDNDIDDLVDLFRGLRRDVGDQKAEIDRLMVDSANYKAETARLKAGTERLNRSLRQEQEDRKVEAARLNRSLRQEQEDRKAETARLNKSLRQEQEERKADSASHREETARLNRALLLEEENRKEENKDLVAETKQLKATITKEREERKAVVAGLEGTIEQQSAEFERELRNAKKQHDDDMQDISELTQKLVPIHLRILLEYSRKKLCSSLGYSNWDELRAGRSIAQLTDVILKGLHNMKDVGRLSRESVEFLCAFNSIRQIRGNQIAHNATQTEIEKAVMLERNAEDASELAELYRFVYPTPL